MRISDWSSDVCSSDLFERTTAEAAINIHRTSGRGITMIARFLWLAGVASASIIASNASAQDAPQPAADNSESAEQATGRGEVIIVTARRRAERRRSEEHTSELQSLMRISYAVFCLKKKII